MKSIKNKYFDAIEYYNKHLELSITTVANLFDCDRHVLSDYLSGSIENLHFLFSDEENKYGFNDNEQLAIELYTESNYTLNEIKDITGVSSATFSR